jgi:Fe-S-cluster-containing hydrogenase component 2
VVVIHVEKCTGCGECLDVCPEGALYLVEDKAAVDEALCSECEACLSTCPEEAILPVVEIPEDKPAHPTTDVSRQPARVPQPEPVHLQPVPEPSRISLWTSVAPAVGSALTVVGRQLMTRLVPTVLDIFDQRTSQPARDSRSEQQKDRPAGRGQGRRQRRRRRGE